MSRRRALLALVLVGALALGACGRKAAPVAPELRAPAAVLDLAAVIRESSVELTWTNPHRRVDSSVLRDVALARVFRVEDAGGGEPKPAMLVDGRIAGWAEVATIRLAAPAPADVQGRRVTFPDREARETGRRYTWVVVTADALGRTSPPSRRVSLTLIAAPAAPPDLRVTPGDREARLAWGPPARLLDGGAPSGTIEYEVLRAPAADAALAVIGRTGAGELALTERNLENDRAVWYAVRAVRTAAGTTAYGPPSARVAVTPRDTTPPSPPAGLVAIPSEGAVRLSWSASPEPDVVTYVVYRADERGELARIGSTQPPNTVFIDRDVVRGVYRYAVTAQDSAAMANESARSNEARVTVP